MYVYTRINVTIASHMYAYTMVVAGIRGGEGMIEQVKLGQVRVCEIWTRSLLFYSPRMSLWDDNDKTTYI